MKQFIQPDLISVKNTHNRLLHFNLDTIESSVMNRIVSTRREFLQETASKAFAATALASVTSKAIAKTGDLPPIRAITRGPKFHWFSYYDKLQFDPSCQYALGMEVDFEHRSPHADDAITVGMVDLNNNDRWMPLGQSRAWCCDTHPRFSPDGRSVVIDSPHGGNGRQMYLIDINGIVS